MLLFLLPNHIITNKINISNIEFDITCEKVFGQIVVLKSNDFITFSAIAFDEFFDEYLTNFDDKFV